MSDNIFTVIRTSDSGIAVSNFRRVRHSASNYFTSIDKSSFTGYNVVATTLNTAGQVGGTLGGAVGAVAIGLGSVAVGTVAGAGFIAAVSGPQVAVTAAVVGIALLVMATYSNRESAHNDLAKFVWNMVDYDSPPENVFATSENLLKAAGAAATLMDDGKSQIKLLGSKLGEAQNRFQQVNVKISEIIGKYNAAHAQLATLPANPAARLLVKNSVADKKQKCAVEMKQIWEKETKAGGAIHQYVRRLVHTSNYLQAPHILALAMKEKLQPNSVVDGTRSITPATYTVSGSTPTAQPSPDDFFKDFPKANECRNSLMKIAKFYDEVMANI